MEFPDNIRSYEIFLISKVGKNAFDILCYPAHGGSLRKLRLSEENAKIGVNDITEDVYLCEMRNEDEKWEFDLNIPEGKKIANIKDFHAKADAIIRLYPDGMVFPDMFAPDDSFADLDDEE